MMNTMLKNENMRERKGKTTSMLRYLVSIFVLLALLVVILLRPAQAQSESEPNAEPNKVENFTENEVVKIVANYFEMSAESAAEAINAIFDKQGAPNAYIKGEEASGALVFGLRYGRGEIVTRAGEQAVVYWRGPSIGFDTGADASKTFTLIYNLDTIDSIYQRFPSVEGSAFFIAGIAVNLQKRGHITLVPMRVGLGGRLGANVSYLRYTREKSFWKF